jgi:ribonuclease-3
MIDLEKVIGYSFKKPSLLQSALVHPSFQKKARDFERLEFLGDRVLGVVIARWIFDEFPKESEGDLAKRLASLVRKEACEWVSNEIKLPTFMRVAKNEANSATSIYSDAVEALIGAIFLDGGLESAENFILLFWRPLFEKYKQPPKDSKSSLQEWAQSRNKTVPQYTTIRVEGPPHSPHFVVEVTVDDIGAICGEGNTKREAEHVAATLFLEKYKKKNK